MLLKIGVNVREENINNKEVNSGNKRGSYKNVQIEEIIVLIKRGFLSKEIALIFNVSQKTIYLRLKEYGIKWYDITPIITSYNIRKPWNKGLTDVYSDETLKQMSIAKKLNPINYWKDKKRYKETNQKISNTLVDFNIKNPNYFFLKSKKGKFYSSKNMKEIYYQSSYELKAMEIMEINNNIISYDRCEFKIQYNNFENNIRYYIPDFLVNYKNGDVKIIEIKPENLINKGKNPYKFESTHKYVKENNMKFEIWTEKELNILI